MPCGVRFRADDLRQCAGLGRGGRCGRACLGPGRAGQTGRQAAGAGRMDGRRIGRNIRTGSGDSRRARTSGWWSAGEQDVEAAFFYTIDTGWGISGPLLFGVLIASGKRADLAVG